MSKPAVYNLELREGATFRATLKWLDAKGRPLNLTGATVVGQIRPEPDSEVLIHELSVGNGGIALQPTLGVIKLLFTPADTEGFTFKRAAWDLKVTWANGDVQYPLEGKVLLARSVTE